MTLKQFGYLATGFAIAYVSFTLLFPVNIFLALPIITVSTLTGIAFAFVPIFDRPLDHWVLAFLKAIYSPTQGFWVITGQKNKVSDNDPLFKNRLQRYLTNIGVTSPAPQPKSAAPLPRMTRLAPSSTPVSQTQAPLSSTPGPSPAPEPTPQLQTTTQTNPAPTALPSSENLSKLVAMANEAHLLQSKIAEAERQIQVLRSMAAQKEIAGPEYAAKFQQASQNLQNLVAQTGKLYQQTSQINQVTAQPTPQNPVAVPTPVVQPQKAHVVVVEPKKEVKTQITLTSLPNVINGVISDEAGNFLEGVIVIIHNSEGLPVRALKTNKLGQFSGATPLPSGTYNLTMEKENMEFDTLQISLEGEVIQPITIHPKKAENGQS